MRRAYLILALSSLAVAASLAALARVSHPPHDTTAAAPVHHGVGLLLKVSDEIQPGNVLVPGQRPDGETLSGTINMLCSDRYTDIGDGATYQSTWLDIAAWPADS